MNTNLREKGSTPNKEACGKTVASKVRIKRDISAGGSRTLWPTCDQPGVSSSFVFDKLNMKLTQRNGGLGEGIAQLFVGEGCEQTRAAWNPPGRSKGVCGSFWTRSHLSPLA